MIMGKPQSIFWCRRVAQASSSGFQVFVTFLSRCLSTLRAFNPEHTMTFSTHFNFGRRSLLAAALLTGLVGWCPPYAMLGFNTCAMKKRAPAAYSAGLAPGSRRARRHTMHIPSLREVVSAEEWALRCDLAACYRLVAAYGWSDLVFTHISAKLPDSVTGGEHQFLINPYGLMFDEITASSLVKVDMACNKLLDSPFPVNPAGFVIHSAVHDARENAGCVMHTHTRAGVAVSAQKAGILPLSQQSTFVLASLAYHDYEGVTTNLDEQPRLVASLGSANHLILRNHGLLAVGPDIPTTFNRLWTLQRACEIQLASDAGHSPNRSIPTDVLRTVPQTRVAASGDTY
eukprot:gene15706-33181_t